MKKAISVITSGSFQEIEKLHKYTTKGQKILAITCHEDDEYFVDGESRLTIYGSHCEGLTHAPDGVHVLVWGGAYTDIGENNEAVGYVPDWWYLDDGLMETPANPIKFIPIDL